MAFGPNPPPIQTHICVKGGLDAIELSCRCRRGDREGQILRPEVLFGAEDMFWGARYGQVCDPFGHIWGFNARLQETSR